MKKLLLGVLLACVLVSGCGSAAMSSDANVADYDYPAEAASETYYDEGDYYDDEYYYGEDADVAMENSSSSTATTGVTFAQNKKIIYQSNVVLETKTYNETYSKLIELINENAGYIEYENYNNEMRSYLRNNSGKGNIVISTNNMTIRIPSKNYSKFMQDGLMLGNVLTRKQTIEDKTSEYNTNKSYVDILNDEAEYLAKQLSVLENELKEAQANDRYYDEIIVNMKDIAARKAQVEKELVPYKRTMDEIDEKVEYSTITMELREVDEFTVIEEVVEEETFGSQLKESWNKAMTTLANMLKGTLLFLIAIIPAVVYIAIFAVIVTIVVIIVKKIRKNKSPKKNRRNMNSSVEPSTFVSDYAATQAAKIAAEQANINPAGRPSNGPAANNGPATKPVNNGPATKPVNNGPAAKSANNGSATKPANNGPAAKPVNNANAEPGANQTAAPNAVASKPEAKKPADNAKAEKPQKVYVSRAEAKAAKEARKANAEEKKAEDNK